MQTSLLFAILLTTQADGTDLIGKVVDSSEKPIANARVFVYTARPRQGTSALCPSCYSDCTKEATTNSTGARLRRETSAWPFLGAGSVAPYLHRRLASVHGPDSAGDKGCLIAREEGDDLAAYRNIKHPAIFRSVKRVI